ncbi:hypothetical protein AGMMS50262_21500 [Bacteroidia bacterium]|nr:hypothetical protein AGMMS50262_21500 [Bacteroidia bacterium]
MTLGGSALAQTPPYMTISQDQTVLGTTSLLVVVDSVNSGAAGSAGNPTRLDFGHAFIVNVFVLSSPSKIDPYLGKTLFLYMQDTQTGTGAVNNWWQQGTPANVPAMTQWSRTASARSNGDSLVRYSLTIADGQYPVLMNSQSYWNSLLDGSIIRPSLYVGFKNPGDTYANYGDAVLNYIDIWGYKNRMSLTSPNIPANRTIDVVVKQYDNIKKNLEDILITDSLKLPAGNYAWYMDDQYGVSPYTYTVNNPNPWLNNIYQSGFKPWINTTHIGAFDLSNLDYWLGDGPDGTTYGAYKMYYTLYYYAINADIVANAPHSPYVDTTTFKNNAYKIRVKIKPYLSPMTNLPDPAFTSSPFMNNAFTIASQNYGDSIAGAQWGTLKNPSETSYNPAGNYLPNDGEYTIAQDIVGIIGGSVNVRPGDWYVPAGGAWVPAKKYDHTSGNGTGFMYIVNAKEAGGIFYKETFEVCPQMNLQFSMWLFNICDGTRDNNSWNVKYRIKPNVHVQIWSGNQPTLPTSGSPLLDYYTGEIPMTGVWEQYLTPIFPVPASVNEITVFYLSVNGSGDGNDFMMDDIQIQRTNGAFDFSVTNVAQCLTSASDEYKIQAVWDTLVIKQSTPYQIGDSIPYKWTFYNTSDPTTITASTIGDSLTIGKAKYPNDTISIEVAGNEVGTYKLEIYAGGGDECSTFSYYVFSPSQKPDLVVNPPAGDICAGTQAGLKIANLTADIASKLTWYYRPDGGTEAQLLDANGNQLTGDTITVYPTRKTTYIAKIAHCSDSISYTMEVGGGDEIGFGRDSLNAGYVYRLCYSADSVRIPIKYPASTAITCTVFQDGIANADTLAFWILDASGKDTIAFNPQRIRPNMSDFRKGKNKITCAVLVDNGVGCGRLQTFDIRFISDFSVWAPGKNLTVPRDSVNWNNDANWYITDSLNNRYAQGGVPMACTNVVIPGDASYYPTLKGAYVVGTDSLPKDDGFEATPKCNDITFQFGGEVAQLQHLEYVRAFVEMNFGTFNVDSTFTNTANLINTDDGNNYYPNYASRNRYYSMSAPLKEMYAGDFSFGGKPNAYMKYADPIAINTVRQDSEAELIQKWTNSINTYKVPFTAGFGFGYEVYPGDLKENWPYKNNQKNLNSALGRVRWPYYYLDNAYADSINPLHKYEGTTTGAGKSIFTYYPEGLPNSPIAKTDTVLRRTTTITNIVTQTFYKNVPQAVSLGNRFILATRFKSKNKA